MNFKFLLNSIKFKLARKSSKKLIKYYNDLGVSIGKSSVFRYPSTVYIDYMRPALVRIGEGVDMNRNFTIMAHDFGHKVFVPLFGEFLSSSGSVCIGNNIYFGANVTILKNVFIGDNCIIGAGSIVTKSIPANSVAAGVPCKVICSIEEYYEKRKQQWELEAIQYAKCIRKYENREPRISDFIPEFGLFIDKHNIDEIGEDNIKSRLKDKYDYWLNNHVAHFDGFEEFLKRTRE